MILTGIILLLQLPAFSAKNPIERVEPMFWWTGMKNQNLQLLVYGENISQYTVMIDYEGVTLEKTNTVENPNYLFLDLKIGSKAKSGKFEIEFQLKNKTKIKHSYELKARSEQSPYRKGFSTEDVVYLLMPDRFANGNPENDNMPTMLEKADRTNPNGRHGGDLAGIVNNLDYIQSLGVTALWLNPFLENNMEAYSYHGYAITDFYNTDARFGTNEDYKNLVDKCHEKGMKVIMDMVLNHCGLNHWFIKDPPTSDWYHKHETYTRSNFRSETLSDPYASEADKKTMLTGWFDTTMPDLNQNNEYLLNYLIQNSIWWVEYAGLDGIRLDTQPYSYKESVTEWGKRIFAEYQNFNIVGEAWLQNISNTSYFQKDSPVAGEYSSNLPVVTDFPMVAALNSAFTEEDGWTTGLFRLYYVLAQDFLYENPSNILVFPDNHDLSRYYSSMRENFDFYKLGLAFLLTTRGIPMIYYGTEILMTGEEHQGHGFIREDYPGGWAGDEINAFTETGLLKEQIEAKKYISTIMNWRKTSPAIQKGKLVQFLPQDGTYVYFRVFENKNVMVILNKNNKEIAFETKRYAECMEGYKTGYEIISGYRIDNLEKIIIPALSAVIIQLDK